LSAALIDLARSKETRARLGAAARVRIETAFDYKQTLSGLAAPYQLVARHQQTRRRFVAGAPAVATVRAADALIWAAARFRRRELGLSEVPGFLAAAGGVGVHAFVKAASLLATARR